MPDTQNPNDKKPHPEQLHQAAKDPKVQLLELAHKYHREGVGWRSSWMPQAEEAEAMFHNRPWKPEEAEELKDQEREPLRFTHARKVVEAMVGFRTQNKYEIAYEPRGDSDTVIADIRTQLARYVWGANQAEYEVGDACLDQYIVGLGWVKTGVQEEDPSEERTHIEHVPWREMFVDPRGRKLNLSDRRYCGRERWMAVDDACALHPEHDAAIRAYATTMRERNGGVAHERVAPADSYRRGEQPAYFTQETNEVRLVELQYRTSERGHWIAYPDGRTEVFDAKNPQHQYIHLASQVMPKLGQPKVVPGQVKKVMFVTFVGDVILEHGPSPYKHTRFQWVPFWGWVDDRGHPYGVMEALKDPQRLINWSYSKLQWIAAAQHVIIQKGSGVDKDELRENAARPDAVIEYTGNLPPQYVTFADKAQLSGSLLEAGINDLQQLGGSPDEMRGQESNAKSGKAILARQDAAIRQQGRYLDNEQRALVMMGEILGSIFDQDFADEKVFRITEVNGTKQLAAINVTDPLRRAELEQKGWRVVGDITQGRYDSTAVGAPLSPSHRQAMLQELDSIMETLPPEAQLMLLDLRLRLLDIPWKDEMAERIKVIQQAVLGPPPGAQPAGPMPGGQPQLPPNMDPTTLNPPGVPAALELPAPPLPPDGALLGEPQTAF
jgi:Phage P22-like portal protein